MTKRLAIFVFLALAIGGALAQAAPNYTGEWKMNASKSDFGPVPAPDKLTRKITHEDPNLAAVTTQSGQQGEVTTEVKYTTDGKDSVNTIRGVEVKSVVKWEGDKLIITYKRDIQGNELAFKETWTMGDEGKTLTITTAISGAMGEFALKLVLEKQ